MSSGNGHLFPPCLLFNITPHMVSPESDLFQSLILKNMLRILGIEKPQNESPEHLALIIVEYFGPKYWTRKGVVGVLTVVKDHSRYMTFRNPKLRRNYVSGKVKNQLNKRIADIQAALRISKCTNIDYIRKLFLLNDHFPNQEAEKP